MQFALRALVYAGWPISEIRKRSILTAPRAMKTPRRIASFTYASLSPSVPAYRAELFRRVATRNFPNFLRFQRRNVLEFWKTRLSASRLGVHDAAIARDHPIFRIERKLFGMDNVRGNSKGLERAKERLVTKTFRYSG